MAEPFTANRELSALRNRLGLVPFVPDEEAPCRRRTFAYVEENRQAVVRIPETNIMPDSRPCQMYFAAQVESAHLDVFLSRCFAN